MFSKRIKTIASFIKKEDIVLDVGCDHGYLSLFLKKNNLCKEVYASEISNLALNVARYNFQKENILIESFLSDGFKNIPVFFNTAVLAGMGTNTIINILKYKKNPNKLVISSHNELPKLRKELNELGYKITKEKVVLENKHYYVIMNCLKGKQKLKESELKFGISNDLEYYQYLLQKNLELLPVVNKEKKEELNNDCQILKEIIGKK